MLDLKFIRENVEAVRKGAQRKRIQAPLDRLLQVDREYREVQTRLEELRHRRKEGSKKVGAAKDSQEGEKLKVQMRELAEELKSLESRCGEKEQELRKLQLLIPNVPSAEVPEGASEADNKPVKLWGEPRKFAFEPKDHAALGESLDLIDIPRAAKIAGSRNYFLKREAVLLETAVLQWSLQHMIRKGFVPLAVPLLVRDEAMVGTAYFPGGEEQAYRIEKDELNLVGTSEVSVTSYHSDEILSESELPKKYVACSPCFRREAGSYGKDTKGLYRVHQFMKVEQVIVDIADESRSMEHLESITRNSEEVLEALELPYRKVLVCAGDLGVPQIKKYDLETWMPSRNSYGETHSASAFFDYQARRLNLRYRGKDSKVRICHTLNNTVIASPRILIAILENCQREDGSVEIPKVLQPLMGNLREIRR